MKLEKITRNRTSVEKVAQKRWYDDACGTALGLELLGERWALLIVRELMYGPRRFGEIKSNLPGISANVLTQRLEGLEASGIVIRRRLPSPANAQVYDLSDWGREAEAIVQVMGRWAARSPRHDPLAYMSTASAMISLRTLLVAERAAGLSLTVAFRFPDDAFVAHLADAKLDIARGIARDADVTFTGNTIALRRTIYGKEGVDGPALLTVDGDRAAAQRFIDLFALPEKI